MSFTLDPSNTSLLFINKYHLPLITTNPSEIRKRIPGGLPAIVRRGRGRRGRPQRRRRRRRVMSALRPARRRARRRRTRGRRLHREVRLRVFLSCGSAVRLQRFCRPLRPLRVDEVQTRVAKLVRGFLWMIEKTVSAGDMHV